MHRRVRLEAGHYDRSLPDEVRVVYVSPLKALSADIHKNLAEPRRGIRRLGEGSGIEVPRITAAVRTGDTTSSERAAMLRTPPHILVTTPESLYLLVTAERSREMLRTVRAVIVDEIHAVIGTRRGAHLALTLERLEAACAGQGSARPRLQRIGLSATQKPIGEVARFLVGNDDSRGDCAIVDEGHRRTIDLAVEVPPSPLTAVMAHEVWEEYYDRLAALINEHRTTLVFVNTRRLAERVARHLSERLGEEAVTAHHGSLSKERRLDAEHRLKTGALKALVATASLELGIDIGHVDLVCQIGSPHRIATLLQRVGRSGHSIAGTPKGRMLPVSLDDLVECAALLRASRRGELDAIVSHDAPLDVLAQQITAETSCDSRTEDELFALTQRAWPYRALSRIDFDAVVAMVSDGFATPRGRRSALVHRDEVNRTLRGRRGSRLLSLVSGGAIPEVADYRVVLEPEDTFIGTVNEDFAIESIAGDIFQLGNASWQIMQVVAGTVRVRDAQGAPPTIPFWLGEAPARSDELSMAVSELRAGIDARLDRDEPRPKSTRPNGLAGERDRPEPRGRAAGDRLHRRGPSRARRRADAVDARPGAVLRRSRRHAARAARAIRQPGEPRLGAGAAQAVLPSVQLRAPGRGNRRCAAAVAGAAALVPARRRVPLSPYRERPGHPRAGVSGCAGLSDPVALERDDLARRAAQSRRTQGAAAVAAHAGRRSDGGRLSGRGRVSGEHSRRSRDPRSSAGEPDCSRLSRRGHGSAAARARARSDPSRRGHLRLARHARAIRVLPRHPQRAAVRLRGRCPARGATDAGGADAPGRRGER